MPIAKAHLSLSGIRNLPVEAFYEYLSSAMNRWGNIEDFKRFVPRLLELLATNWPSDTFMMLSKFSMARWRKWPIAERESVEKYFNAVWLVRWRSPSEITIKRSVKMVHNMYLDVTACRVFL